VKSKQKKNKYKCGCFFFVFFSSKLITLKLAGNQLLSFPNDRIDVLASLLHLDVSRNHIDHLPVDLPYLYRVKQVSIRLKPFLFIYSSLFTTSGRENTQRRQKQIDVCLTWFSCTWVCTICVPQITITLLHWALLLLECFIIIVVAIFICFYVFYSCLVCVCHIIIKGYLPYLNTHKYTHKDTQRHTT